MANELNIQLDPFNQAGLTLLGRVYNKSGAEQTGSPVSMSEVSSGLYSGNLAVSSFLDDAYSVRFETNAPDKLYATGELYVRNGVEVSQEDFFNGALDTVANVTLVDTTTTNTDMLTVTAIDTELTNNHGTGSWQTGSSGTVDANIVSVDGNTVTSADDFKSDVSNLDVAVSTRNSVAPDNAGITANGNAISALNDISAADVDTELTSNHGTGSWQSAAGTVNANVISVDGNTVSSADDFKADVSGLSTFDSSSDTVITDTASREASKADLSDVGTRDNQNIINENVKKSSKLIPASGNLPDS